jgi:DNA modification methylase
MRAPYLDDGDVRLYLGDCIEVLAEMDAESVDAVVCDPPYGLEFMGKDWDSFAPGTMRKRSGWDDAQSGASITVSGFDRLGKNGTPAYGGIRSSYECARCGRRDAFRKASCCGTHEEHDWRAINPNGTAPLVAFAAWCETWAREALRVLKPGGHLLAFGGTRTYHRLTCGIEDAGFEIRDSIAWNGAPLPTVLQWVYGSGFPKSLDVSKAIDKKRDDRDDVLAVTAEIARLRDAVGMTNRDLDAVFGFAGMAGHWTSVKSQPAIPTVEQWAALREMLDPPAWVEAEVWRLNGRKGEPGEAWHEREVVGRGRSAIANKEEGPRHTVGASRAVEFDLTAPATEAAQAWQGWGTALKPGWEPCVVARKPLAGTVAENVQRYGTGALNIDATRIGVTWDNGVSLCDSCAEDAAATAKRITPETVASTARNSVAPMPNARDRTTRADTCRADTGCSRGPNREGHAEGLLVDSSLSTGASGNSTTDLSPTGGSSTTSTESRPTTGSRTCASCGAQTITASTRSSGRWPSNVALDEQAAAMLDAQSGERGGAAPASGPTHVGPSSRDRMSGDFAGMGDRAPSYFGDTGGASRFYYTAKASRADRNTSGATNTHPTVKPTDLMRWLVRLVTPPGGVVLDPFAGSGSTLVAARAEGFRAIGIEREDEYAEIIAQRLSQLSLFSEAS